MKRLEILINPGKPTPAITEINDKEIPDDLMVGLLRLPQYYDELVLEGLYEPGTFTITSACDKNSYLSKEAIDELIYESDGEMFINDINC